MKQFVRILTIAAALWCGLALADDSSDATPAPMSATEVQAANAKATAANALIDQEQKAEEAKDWAGAEAALKKLTAMDPTHWDYFQHLANAQYNQGKYADASKAYATALAGAEKDTADPDPDAAKQAMANMYTNQGNAYLKLKKTKDGVAAFEKAAALSDNPGVAYFNICATLFNQGEDEGALAACDKAIEADPKRADAYFIKGSILTSQGETNSNNQFVVPKGTVEALKMYLKLAPRGPHAADVQQMLDLIGS